MIRRTRGEKIFNVVNIVLLMFVGALALYPCLYTLTLSLSDKTAAESAGLHIFPMPGSFSLASYKAVATNPEILIGYGNSIFRTVVGTALTLFMTSLVAYPLSRRNLPHRRAITFFILFTMIFNGGLVPMYLLMKGLHLLNSRMALILPIMMTAFNIIVIKNFFQSIPESLGESARIDGASELTILLRIYMPLSKPVLATVALWTAVAHWNHWFDALIFITDNSKQVLQVYLQRIVIENSTQMIEAGLVGEDITGYTPETIKAATVIVTILPMLLVYPFVQRYFVKGIMLGSVKE